MEPRETIRSVTPTSSLLAEHAFAARLILGLSAVFVMLTSAPETAEARFDFAACKLIYRKFAGLAEAPPIAPTMARTGHAFLREEITGLNAENGKAILDRLSQLGPPYSENRKLFWTHRGQIYRELGVVDQKVHDLIESIQRSAVEQAKRNMPPNESVEIAQNTIFWGKGDPIHGAETYEGPSTMDTPRWWSRSPSVAEPRGELKFEVRRVNGSGPKLRS